MFTRDPFNTRDHDPATHLRLNFYGALLLLREIAPDAAVPLSYLEELSAAGFTGPATRAQRQEWDRRLEMWEGAALQPLPLARLSEVTGIDRLGRLVTVLCGLAGEDARISQVTLRLLRGCWTDPQDRQSARTTLAKLIRVGLLHHDGDDCLHPAAGVWEALNGSGPERLIPPGQLPELTDLILEPYVQERIPAALDWLSRRRAGVLAVRGSRGSGRRTVSRALARAAGLGVLEHDLEAAGPDRADRATDRSGAEIPLSAFTLAALADAALLAVPDTRISTVRASGAAAPIIIVMQPGGTVEGDAAVFTLDLPVPGPQARRSHWEQAFTALGTPQEPGELDTLAAAHRLTGGLIRRIAPAALAEARTGGRRRVTPADVTRAGRVVLPPPPPSLLTRLDVSDDWSRLVVPEPVRTELGTLEQRCRLREQLAELLPAALAGHRSLGVRALFTGPSGTGKTLAARVLAGVLGKDLFCLDVSGVVDKYLGETEKNLDRVLSHTQALDAVLLIDEGDALMSQRTDVSSSNDRYANLETNYLLQRLDAFEGIVVITTNAEQHLDRAFERRLDVVIDFQPPGIPERAQLWHGHLPEQHAVGPDLLAEVGARCALTGGQIRNVVLHAGLLALSDHRPLDDRHLLTAVRREFNKQGAACPVRSLPGPAGHVGRGA